MPIPVENYDVVSELKHFEIFCAIMNFGACSNYVTIFLQTCYMLRLHAGFYALISCRALLYII